MPSEILKAALLYASLGWRVIPLSNPRDPSIPIDARGKRPTLAGWPQKATTDAERIRQWFEHDHPAANLGIVLGVPSTIMVCDIDPRNGGTWDRFPETYTVLSGRGDGGRHLYYRHPGGDVRSRKYAPGIDVLCDDGHQVVAPPSLHPRTLAPYTRLNDPSRIVDPPDWIFSSIAVAKQEAKPETPNHAPTNGTSPWAAKALRDEADTVARAQEGGRNDALNRAAYNLFQIVAGGDLDESTVISELGGAALQAGLERTEIRATLRSAREAARAQPRTRPAPTKPTPAPARQDSRIVQASSDSIQLLIGQSGSPRATIGNCMAILEGDARLAGLFARDVRADRTVVTRTPPWQVPGHVEYPHPLTDSDCVRACQWCEQAHHGVTFAPDMMHRALVTASEAHPFDPVARYLDALKWDETPRVATWLSAYLGAADNALTRTIAERWLISAVARTFEPGCQVDHVLVLEGAQGSGKSSALRVIGGPWFKDDLPDIGSKDAPIALDGAWVFELAELDATRRQEATKVKAWITRTRDHYRPPYGICQVERPRRVVFAASTNEREYSHDATGNRRFWPVRCGTIDPDGLAAVRDQLWAEAVALYKGGNKWWIENVGMRKEAEQEQELRQEAEDPWIAALASWAQDRAYCTVAGALAHLGVDTSKTTTFDGRRVVACLRALGYADKRRARDGRSREVRYYPTDSLATLAGPATRET
jgi:predicted P-loop ATPase